MDKWLVMTSINPPHRRLSEFLDLGYRIVVAGDAKSCDADWESLPAGIVYLSLREQEALFPELAACTPSGNYARKNFAYLYAAAQGGQLIWETDDDNFVRNSVGDPIQFLGNATVSITSASPLFNPYSVFLPDAGVWPRGYPLSAVARDRDRREELLSVASVSFAESIAAPMVLQCLVAGQPDVDAIYRLTVGDLVVVPEPTKVVVSVPKGTWSPGNTQATFWVQSDVFKWMYVPSTVSFRFADILKMYVAQVGNTLHYGGFLMEQKRNAHDFLSDFRAEVQMYLSVESVLQTLDSCPAELSEIYRLLGVQSLCSPAEAEIAACFESMMETACAGHA